MIVSYKLLSKFVDLEGITPDELCDKLTFAGFEVEGKKRLAYADKLCVGHVISCLPHPDSDHLHVLKVDCGQEGVLDIVCGAPNVCKDAYVIVALVGCNLKAIDVTIKKGVIRGCESNGMCCSLVELGVDKSVLSEEETKGIHLLPNTSKPGDRNVLELLGLDDTIIDINVLANRPDCLSIIGLAKEIGTVLNRKVVDLPVFDLEENDVFKVSSVTKNCDAFHFVKVSNLKNIVIPQSIVSYLNAHGMKSISPLVDIGNFSMLLTGQPLHMYDLSKVDGELVARDDFEGKVLALDDNEYDVKKGDVVIADKSKVCCLGGVMGLRSVEIDENTSVVGIEAAHFYHAQIRHEVKRLGLSSPSSSLFIKGTNPYIIKDSLAVTLALIKYLCKDAVIEGYSKFDEVKPLNPSFDFSLARLNSRLGSDFTEEEVDSIISRVGLVREGDKVLSSKYRLDLAEQCDIEEEVFRLSSKDRSKLTIENLPQTIGARNEKQLKRMKIRNHLVSLGFNQIQSYTLVSAKMDRELRVFDDEESYKIANPMTGDHEYVRSDLLSSMMSVIEYNLFRKNENLKLFEISSVERKGGNRQYLSIAFVNNVLDRGMLVSHKADFFDIKGVVISLFNLLGIDDKRYTLVRSNCPSFHPYRSADIMIGKKKVATFGELHPSLKKDNIAIAEINLTDLYEIKTSKLKCVPLSSLQPLRRDLAFNLLDDVYASDIIREIKKAGGQYVKDVFVFDEFIKDNKRSLAFAIYFKKEDKSFTDAEINSLLNTIILNVTHKLKVELKSL